MIKLEQIISDLSLDTVDDLQQYIASYSAFEVGKHRVVLSVCKDGDTIFTVDGACDYDNVNPITGAIILRRLLKEWRKLVTTLTVTPFCYPTETDGLADRRVKMFQLAGFELVGEDGKLVYNK